MTLLTGSVDSVVILVASVFVTFFSGNTIALEKSSFAPLSTVHGNQLSVSVKYEVNDKSLANQKINGLMKIYSTNGILIHSTSFPAGFDAKKKGGEEELKITIRDPHLIK